MSSSPNTAEPPFSELETVNGTIKVAGPAHSQDTFGLLIERGPHVAGLLLSRAQAQRLAELLSCEPRLARSPAHQTADR